ncbi:putative non-specific serine/threonine protein kinase [Dioscorea sansibarensis]
MAKLRGHDLSKVSTTMRGTIGYLAPEWISGLLPITVKVEGEVDLEELKRVSKVACWCVLDSDAMRPTVGQVMQLLEGVLDVDTPPIPRSLQNLINGPHSVYYSLPLDAETDSENQTSLFYSLPLTETT